MEVTRRCDVGLRFVMDDADTAGGPNPVDPSYPSGSPGWARGDNGSTIGAARHQFRNERGGGFTARIAVAFPATLPRGSPSGRWHLGCEFSNWMTAPRRILSQAGGSLPFRQCSPRRVRQTFLHLDSCRDAAELENSYGSVPQTSTRAVTNATLPYLRRLANLRLRRRCHTIENWHLVSNTRDGAITHPGVAETFPDLPSA